MIPERFEIGDVVCLNGPSSAMTVIALADDPDTYICAWHNAERALCQHAFKGVALRKWSERR